MTKAKEICQDCGKVFLGGPKAFFCPDCIKRRQRAVGRSLGLSRLGVEARRKKGEKAE